MSLLDFSRVVPEVRTGAYDAAFAKNGNVADGGALAAIANFSYSNLMRRRRVLYNRVSQLGAGTFIVSGYSHRARIYIASEFIAGGVFCTLLYGDSGIAGTAGLATFNVNGVAQAYPSVPASTGSAVAGPSDLKRVTFDISAHVNSGVNDIDWSVAANSGIYGVIIYGVLARASDTLDANTSVYPYKTGSPVAAADFSGLVTASWDQWRQEATHHFHWSGALQVTGTTYKNFIDSSTGGYSSSAAGFWTIPYRQATLSGSTVNAKFWVNAKTDVGTTGRVRLVNSTGILGTISGIGTASAYYSMDVSLDPTITTSDLVIIEMSDATVGRTITLNGAGLYSFSS